MKRFNIINILGKYIKAKSYLEIGVANGTNFSKVNIENKLGVDPDPTSKATIIDTSDSFFAKNDKYFDIIFIDGLHHKEQLEKDINNSLKFLNNNGYIICHDVLPLNKNMQEVPRTQC